MDTEGKCKVSEGEFIRLILADNGLKAAFMKDWWNEAILKANGSFDQTSCDKCT